MGHYIDQLVLLAFVSLGIVSGGTSAESRQALVELSLAIDGIEGMRFVSLRVLFITIYILHVKLHDKMHAFLLLARIFRVEI